jgi:hypothetical protein
MVFKWLLYLIRFLSCVSSFVVCTLLVGHEGFVAETASVSLVAAMCPFMLQKCKRKRQ